MNNRLTDIIIGAAIDVHKTLGPGLLESVYQTCLCHELKNRGLKIEKEKALPIGLLINFLIKLLKNGLKRFVNSPQQGSV